MTDAELIECATEMRRGILGSQSSRWMCAAVAWPLQGYLSALCGIETEAVRVEIDMDVSCDHVFLRLPDGRVLDPTADQFEELGLPPVYLGEPHPKIHIDVVNLSS